MLIEERNPSFMCALCVNKCGKLSKSVDFIHILVELLSFLAKSRFVTIETLNESMKNNSIKSPKGEKCGKS